MDLKIQVNWDLEYFFLKKQRRAYQKRYDNIIEQLKSTPKDDTRKINDLVNQYNEVQHLEKTIWIHMCDFAKNKKEYQKYYKENITKVLNKID